MAKITQPVATLILVLGTLVNSQVTDPTTNIQTDPPKAPPSPPKPDDPTTVPPTPVPTTEPTPEPTTEPTPAPEPAPEPTPAPANDYFYNITEGNVTCVMIDGDFSFLIALEANDTKKVKVVIPKHNADVTGACNGTDGTQRITLTWGKNSATFVFESTKSMWNISSYTATLVLDGSDFKNTSLFDKEMTLQINLALTPVEVAVNHSYKCISHLDSSTQASIDGIEYDNTVLADMDGMQIQAFNMIANEPDFVDATHCTADETSDIVPIAVGCALAGLVVIVLIAYLVGRRRRSAAYQSV